jgi:hypothetical protein
MCFYFLYIFCLKHFSFKEEFSQILLQKYTVFHGNYPLFMSYFNQISIFLTYFKKINIKLHENVSSGNQVFPCRWMNRHDKETVAFHNFSNVPRNYSIQGQCRQENHKTAHISESTGDCLSYRQLHCISYWNLSPVWCDELHSQQSAIWHYCWYSKKSSARWRQLCVCIKLWYKLGKNAIGTLKNFRYCLGKENNVHN